MSGGNYCAVYDFELLPYALGDVLTWNIQTAIRCEDLGREKVDVFICMDERYPSSIYQRGLVTAGNCGLFFNELFGAFGTHPRLGSLLLYRRREEMLERLNEVSKGDVANAAALADYERALAGRDDSAVLNEYFTKYIYFHEQINGFAEKHGRIPLLRPSLGCEADVAGLVTKRLADKRIVPIHIRLRRLDTGYGGEHTYFRDSDFLEWYEFLREAGKKYPDVQFVVLGRLQEKPLELLRMSNVMSLRTLGLGLGHELTLMLRSDLFIGTSSGFAAMANFSEVPYFITKMSQESCNAYRIENGAKRLPFATDRQILVYEPETRALLMRLLKRGLAEAPRRSGGPAPSVNPAIDVSSWEWERTQWLHPGATTGRFFLDETYRDKETAFLLWPRLQEARAAWRNGRKRRAWFILRRIETNFPRMCANFPEFLRLRGMLAAEKTEWNILRACEANLRRLAAQDKVRARAIRTLKKYLVWGFPLKIRVRHAWRNRRLIPARIRQMLRRFAGLGSV
jgi:hypothetical protein